MNATTSSRVGGALAEIDQSVYGRIMEQPQFWYDTSSDGRVRGGTMRP